MRRRSLAPARADADPGAGGAYREALKILARRELSGAQLRQRLRARGYPAADIDAALERLGAAGALDDRRTADAVVRAGLRAHHGPGRLRAALDRAGIAPELARRVVGEHLANTSEPEAIERALERRWRRRIPDLSDPAERRRTRDYLLRQGFTTAAIIDALRRHRGRPGAEAESDDDVGEET